jgi:2-polyprenyl-6-methoxyphenol hydroxylase-like FAD-dependent oxidoreductase
MRAIIIGAGIGGLAAAIGLRRAGLDVAVYERAAALAEVGAGITLWPNAIKALRQLGLDDAIRAIGVLEGQGGIRTPRGMLLASGAAADLEREFGAPTLAMHRADLHAALLEALGAEHVRLGTPCVGFDQGARSVTARFAGGISDSADLLIGADGLRSAVRAQLHGDQPPRYAGYTAWRAVLPFDHARLVAGETWGAGARFGQVPLGDGRVYWFATENTRAGERSPDGEKAALLRLFRGWHAPIEQLIAATPESDILRHDIFDRPPLRRWGAGRITLLGDAAHAMTPNLGQGACQAIEDAVVLMKQLGAGGDVPAALRAYEAARAPRTARLVRQSRQIGDVGQWQGPLSVAARDLLLRLLGPRLQARQLAPVVGYEV